MFDFPKNWSFFQNLYEFYCNREPGKEVVSITSNTEELFQLFQNIYPELKEIYFGMENQKIHILFITKEDKFLEENLDKFFSNSDFGQIDQVA